MNPNQPAQVACLGEAMLELSPRDGGELYQLGVAGDVLNTAAGISLLGGSATFVSATGNDANSAALTEHCGQLGVDTRHLLTDEAASIGLYLIRNNARGERFFSYWRDQSAAHCLFSDAGRMAELLDSLKDYRALYLSGITLSRTSPQSRQVLWDYLERRRADGAEIIYDGNYRPALWPSRQQALEAHCQGASLSTVFLPGMEDEMHLRDSTDKAAILTQLLCSGAAEILVKDGAEPVQLSVGGAPWTSVPTTPAASVIDTAGAGDSFNAGYLAARQQRVTPGAAATFAGRVSAMVIQQRGAIPPPSAWQPLRESLAQLL